MRRTPARRVLTAALAVLLGALHLSPAAGAQEEDRAATADAAVSDEQLIEDAYRALLGRAPDADGRQYWRQRLDGGLSEPELLAQLAATEEHRRHLVTEAFRAHLDREPDAGALDWYAGLLARSTTAVTVRADVLGSEEYFRRSGGSPEAWLDAVYRDVLGRAPDPAGRDHFLGQLRSGVPREPIASAILVAPEASEGPPLGIEAITPERQALVRSLDAVRVDLDQPVIPQLATIVVTVGGQRVAGTVSEGDFDDILVFSLAEGAPDPVPAGERGSFAVTVVAHDGDRVGRADAGFHYERPVASLSRGDTGPAVTDLQNDLAQRGYWVGPVDGVYGALTQQAVYAFQKAEGLERTGTADPAVLRAIEVAGRPRPRSTSGTVWEIDKARQLLIYAVDGRAVWVWNTSTGTEEPYTYDGERYVADTPPGRWDVYRQVDGIREGALGRLYRPKYFHTDGIAVHGYPSVPPYPASHGCVRVTNAAIDWIWANDVMPLGVDVWVY